MSASAEPRPGYCWGRPKDTAFAYAALSGLGAAALIHGTLDYAPSRPALDDAVWAEVDRALDEARRACELNLLIVLVPEGAHDTARSLYVWAEPGPDVIAIGHADRSVSFCIDEQTSDANAAPLDKLLSAASAALLRDDVAGALLAVASNVASLRRSRT